MHLNLRSIDNQLTWIRNQLTNKINRITHRLTTKSLESQINWQPTHLNLESIDNQIIWISNWLTTKSIESQTNWQPPHLKFESTDNQNHLKHTSIDNQIIWISNRLTTKSFDSQFTWIWHQLTFEPIELNTHPLPIGSLSLETSATALCGRYVNSRLPKANRGGFFSISIESIDWRGGGYFHFLIFKIMGEVSPRSGGLWGLGVSGSLSLCLGIWGWVLCRSRFAGGFGGGSRPALAALKG